MKARRKTCFFCRFALYEQNNFVDLQHEESKSAVKVPRFAHSNSQFNPILQGYENGNSSFERS